MDKRIEKEKRCLFCGKLIISEEVPICLRCKLVGRDYGGKCIGGITLFWLTWNKRKVLVNKVRNNK